MIYLIDQPSENLVRRLLVAGDPSALNTSVTLSGDLERTHPTLSVEKIYLSSTVISIIREGLVKDANETCRISKSQKFWRNSKLLGSV